MSAPDRLHHAFETARMYYDEGRTMEAIAQQLEVSRSTVSRMLRDAREEGPEDTERLLERAEPVRSRRQLRAPAPDPAGRAILGDVEEGAGPGRVRGDAVCSPGTVAARR